MNDLDLDKLDPTFESDLEKSKVAVRAVKDWLSRCGFQVTERPVIVRPTAAERFEYADDGDLDLLHRVEVKHRDKIDFTCAQDFPFSTVIVDVCHSYDKARPKPFAYVIANKPLSHAMVIYVRETRKEWEKKEIWSRNRLRWHYLCPIELARFVNLSEERDEPEGPAGAAAQT